MAENVSSFKLVTRKCIDGSENIQKIFWNSCEWSKNGMFLASGYGDQNLLIFKTPWMTPIEKPMKIREGDYIYDYCFTQMNNCDKSLIFTSSKQLPIHLWDIENNNIIKTINITNHVEEQMNCYNMYCSKNNSSVFCGLKKKIAVFDIEESSDDVISFIDSNKNKNNLHQSNIISALEVTDDQTVLFAGSYDSTLGFYDLQSYKPIDVIKFDKFYSDSFDLSNNGVSQIQYIPSINKILVGFKKSNIIICLDFRNLSQIYQVLNRKSYTNQKIRFDYQEDQKILVTGQTDGSIKSWTYPFHENGDENNLFIDNEFFLGDDNHNVINAIKFNPIWPNLLSTSSGDRRTINNGFISIWWHYTDTNNNNIIC